MPTLPPNNDGVNPLRKPTSSLPAQISQEKEVAKGHRRIKTEKNSSHLIPPSEHITKGEGGFHERVFHSLGPTDSLIDKSKSGQTASNPAFFKSESKDDEFLDAEEFFDSEEFFDAKAFLDSECQDALESPNISSSSSEIDPLEKSISDRSVSENLSKKSGWFSWLPLFRKKEKPANKRSVTPSQIDAEMELINQDIWGVIKTRLIDKYVTGFKSWEITNTLKTISSVYHQWKNRSEGSKGVTPEHISLPCLTIPNAAGEGRDLILDQVHIKVRKVRPCGPGEGDDKFKQLRLLVDITGHAELWTNGVKFKGAVELNDVLIDLDFKEGAVVSKFLENGSLTGTTRRALWQLFSLNTLKNIKNYALGKLLKAGAASPSILEVFKEFLTKNIIPASIRIKPAHNRIRFDGASGDNSTCAIELGFDEIKIIPVHENHDGTESLHAEIKGMKVTGQGRKLLNFFPEDIHDEVAAYLPNAEYANTAAEIEIDVLSLKAKENTFTASCPNIRGVARGDVDISQGKIKNLVAVVNTDATSQFSQATVGFDEIKAQGHIPETTFALRYDVKGPVHCGEGVIKIDPVKNSADSTLKGAKITALFDRIEADIDGGLEFKGKLEKVAAEFSTTERKFKMTSRNTSASHFNIGQGGSHITDSNQIVRGEDGSFQEIEITVTPVSDLDQDKASPITKIKVARAETKHLNGMIIANQTNLSDVAITHQFKGELKQQVDVEVKAVEGTHLEISDNTSAGLLEATLETANVTDAKICCEILSAHTTESEREVAKNALLIPHETWKIPKTTIVAANTTVNLSTASGDIDALILSPGQADLSNEPTNQPAPHAAGTYQISRPTLTVNYDASNGVETANLEIPSATINLNHGDIRGDIHAEEIQADYHKNSTTHATVSTVSATMAKATGEDLTVDGILPEGISVKTNFAVIHPAAKIAIDNSYDASDAVQKQKPHTTSELTLKDSEIKAEIEIDRSKFVPASTKDKVAKIRAFLPKEYVAKLEKPLHYLETIEEIPENQTDHSTLKQTVEVKTDHLHTTIKTGHTNNVGILAEDIEINLPDGNIQGCTNLTDVEFNANQQASSFNVDLNIDKAVVDHLSTQGTANVHMNSPAIVTGLSAQVTLGAVSRSTTVKVESAAIDMYAGVNGIAELGTESEHPLRPLHLTMNAQHFNLHASQRPTGLEATTNVERVKLKIDETSDQFGVDIEVTADISDGLLAACSTPEALRMDATADKIKIKTDGAFQGTMDIHGAGITAIQDDECIKINTRIDSQKTKFDFNDPVKDIVGIFTKQRLAQSPLGKACELSISPELDSTLTGTMSGSASGVLSPLIALTLSVITKRSTRLLLRIADLFSGTMKFGITVDKLPVNDGHILSKDLLKYTRITITSERGLHGKIYAGLISFMANYISPWILEPVMKSMNLADKKTGEISLSKLASYTGQNIQMVKQAELTELRPRDSENILDDVHQRLLINQKLPAHWTEKLYIDGLEQAITTMRWKNKQLGKSMLLTEKQLRDMAKQIALDFPSPSTSGEFRRVTAILDKLQHKLRNTAQLPPLEYMYYSARDEIAQEAAIKYRKKAGTFPPSTRG